MFVIATEEEEHNPLIPPIGEVIVGAIGFAIVCFIFMKYVFPRMEATFQARREAIEGGLAKAEQSQVEAQRLLEEYKAQLAAARTEAAQIRDAARAEGQRIVEELREQAQAEAARIQQRGEEQLAASRQHIVQELRGEIGRLSVTLAERVVGESLEDDERRGRTVDRFLAELDDMSAPEATGGTSRGTR